MRAGSPRCALHPVVEQDYWNRTGYGTKEIVNDAANISSLAGAQPASLGDGYWWPDLDFLMTGGQGCPGTFNLTVRSPPPSSTSRGNVLPCWGRHATPCAGRRRCLRSPTSLLIDCTPPSCFVCCFRCIFFSPWSVHTRGRVGPPFLSWSSECALRVHARHVCACVSDRRTVPASPTLSTAPSSPCGT